MNLPLSWGLSVTGAERTTWRGGEISSMQAPEIQSEPEELDRETETKAACDIIYMPSQQKMQSQLHKHHAST